MYKDIIIIIDLSEKMKNTDRLSLTNKLIQVQQQRSGTESEDNEIFYLPLGPSPKYAVIKPQTKNALPLFQSANRLSLKTSEGLQRLQSENIFIK